MNTDKGRRLGRGLEALLAKAPVRPDPSPAEAPPPTPTVVTANTDASIPYRTIPVTKIRPNPLQPRKEFKEEELADLEASLRVSGLLQPVTVRPARAGGGFELIAGERRFRASQRLGWTEIPAIVREVALYGDERQGDIAFRAIVDPVGPVPAAVRWNTIVTVTILPGTATSAP